MATLDNRSGYNMKSVLPVTMFIREYYAEVEVQEIVQDVSTVAVIYQDGEKTTMDMWAIDTEPKGNGRATIQLNVACVKCMDDTCECKLQPHWDASIMEDMKPIVMTEPRVSYKLEKRQPVSEFVNEYVPSTMCTCEYEEKRAEPNSFFENHGMCEPCFRL